MSTRAPALAVLWPAERAGEVVPGEDAERGEPALRALYAPPGSAPGGRWVRANMVSTLDGAAWGPDASTRSIGSPADLRVLRLLRAVADAVLVGAGTVRAEGYGLLRPGTELAVVSRSGRLPSGRGLLPAERDDGRSALVVTCAGAGAAALADLRAAVGDERVVVAGDEQVDLPRALDALAERGLRQVLCEGGPALLRDLLGAGLLDELCLTWSPLLAGGDAGRLLADGGPLGRPARLAHLLHAEGTLLGRWLLG